MFFVGLSAGGLIVASSAQRVRHREVQARGACLRSSCPRCASCLRRHVRADRPGRHPARLAHLHPPELHQPAGCGTCASSRCTWSSTCWIYTSWHATKAMSATVKHAVLRGAAGRHPGAQRDGVDLRRWRSPRRAGTRPSWRPSSWHRPCDSGLALLLVRAGGGAARPAMFDCGTRPVRATWRGLLATFIAVDAFFIGCELLTTAYPGDRRAHPMCSAS